jgi:RHS repeat-associated protein
MHIYQTERTKSRAVLGDRTTTLEVNRPRYYDATVARWISEDPQGYKPDVNLYRYVGNNPINGVDPSGLQEKAPVPINLSIFGADWPDQADITASTLSDIWKGLEKQKIGDSGKCIAQLEIGTHGGSAHFTFPKPREVVGKTTDEELMSEKAQWVDSVNLQYFVDGLNSRVKWCCPCVIIMSVCHVGQRKPKGSVPSFCQRLSNLTGCYLLGPMAAINGSVLKEEWEIKPYRDPKRDYQDTANYYASRAKTWRLFTPSEPNRNNCKDKCPQKLLKRLTDKGDSIFEPPGDKK